MGKPRFDKDGFRIRGHEMTRTEAFTDAAFAFAVTLLVISIDVIPSNYAELRQALDGIPAFAASFLVLAIFWYGHWNWSRRFGLEDFPSIALSLGLVFVMLSYVYPMKFLASLSVAWLSGDFGARAMLTGIDQLYDLFAIYGLGFIAMSLVLAGLNAHALRCRAQLGLDPLEVYLTRAEITAWIILAAVGSLSVALALFTPATPYVLPGWTYMLLGIVMPILARRAGRRARQLAAAREAAHTPRAAHPT
ncbi:MAG: TMEM175 family protein [Gemmatimonadetes bacterium]|nr:TMEM175 family protein [Gemmatimonadota bacterium]